MPGVGFEIEALVHPDNSRPLRKFMRLRSFKGKGAAPAGLQANGWHVAQRGNLIGPGAGGVDQLPSLDNAAVSQVHVPQTVGKAACYQFGVAAQLTTGLTKATQKTLMQGMHVKVHRPRLMNRTRQRVAAQAWHHCRGGLGIKQAHLGAVGQVLRVAAR
ncbi:hypothetical protein D3C77_508630 [compost metagenome]